MYRLIIFATILALAYATPVGKCRDNKPEIVALRVEGCNEQPCKFVGGETAKIEVDFVAPYHLPEVTMNVVVRALGYVINYKLPERIANVCKNLDFGASCPLKENEKATYKIEFPVSKRLPAVKANLELTMVDQNNKPINCFSVDVQIVKQ